MNNTHSSGFGPTKFNSLLKKKVSPRRVKGPRHASVKPVAYANELGKPQN